jgi:predicted P-loop ATPase
MTIYFENKLIMNPKNKLQNILQINKQKLHRYNYIIKNSYYVSTVVFEINNKKFQIEGLLKSNKKESSDSAATIAFNYIKSTGFFNQKIKTTHKINNIVLIDVENVGYKYLHKNEKVIGFISKHCLYNKIDKIKEYMELEIYDGIDKNGADTLMIFYIGKNIEYYIKNKCKIIIISNDRFAKCIFNV